MIPKRKIMKKIFCLLLLLFLPLSMYADKLWSEMSEEEILEEFKDYMVLVTYYIVVESDGIIYSSEIQGFSYDKLACLDGNAMYDTPPKMNGVFAYRDGTIYDTQGIQKAREIVYKDWKKQFSELPGRVSMKEGGYSGKINIPEKVSISSSKVTSFTCKGDGKWYGPVDLSSLCRNFGQDYTSIIGSIDVTDADGFNPSQEGLISVSFPKSIVELPTTLAGCVNLETVKFGNKVKILPSFAGCTNLKRINPTNSHPINIPSSVEKMYSFENCVSIEEMVLPDNLTFSDRSYGGTALFKGCTGLKSLTFGKGIESIPNSMCEGCISLKEIIIPQQVTTIGQYSFSDCESLDSLGFEDNPQLTSIGYFAFRNCTALKTIKLKQPLKIIEAGAFYNCSSVYLLILPGTLESIKTNGYEGAFYDCKSLKEIYAYMTNPFEIGVYTFRCTGDKTLRDYVYENATLRVPTFYPIGDATDRYEETDYWSMFKKIKSFTEFEISWHEENYLSFSDPKVEELCLDHWDANNNGFLSVAEAKAVTSLGEVFRNSEITTFDELQYFTGLTKLDNNAFTNCKLLTDLTIPTNVTTIGESVFAGCEKLTGLKVAEGNASFSMDDGVLYNKNYTSLIFCPVAKTGTVTVNSTTTTIRENAFYNCTQLTGISLPSSLTTISPAAFVGCSSLTTIAIPANVSSIGMGCFTGCTALKSITVDTGNSAYSASDGVLVENQTKLMAYPNAKGDTYAVGEGVTTIDGYAFCMTGIKSLTLPSTLKTISDYAISYCSNLTTITSYATVPPIVSATAFSEGTFSGAMLNVPIGCKESYSTTDVWKNFSNIVEIGKDGSEFISISSAKQVTYMSDKGLDFTGYPDLKAYVATGYDKASGTIWLTRVKEVPANTGFLLMGEAGDYEIPVKKGESTSYYMNLFKGTIEGTTIQTTDGDNTNYYLSNGDAGVGFYKVQGSVELKPNRAYLSVPTEIPAVGTAGSTETIKVSAAGQVPYYNSQSLDFSSLDAQGVKAYTATGYDYSSGTIWLTRVKQVPAETGILIMAPQGEYPVPTASVASVYANMFRGTLEGTTIQTHEEIDGKDYINYYLSSGASGVGFYRVTKEEGVTIGANRCYLPILNKDAAAGTRSANSDLTQIAFEEADEAIGIPLLRGIGGDEDGTTGVKEVKSGEVKGEKWYTLQGQRVAKPGKGLYIRNGKVVVIK